MTDHFESLTNPTNGGGESLESRMEVLRNSRVEAMARQIAQQRTMLFIMAAMVVMVSLWDRWSIRGAANSIANTTAQLATLHDSATGGNGSGTFETLKAQNIEIVGADGKVAMKLTVNSKGGSFIAMTPEGKPVIEIGACEGETGGVIVAKSSTGSVIGRFGAGEGGDGVMVAADRDGRELVRMAAASSGGSVVIQNSEGDPRIRLLSNPEGSAVAVFNNNGTPVCTLTPDEKGNGLIGAWNHEDGGQTLQGGAMTGTGSMQKTSATDHNSH